MKDPARPADPREPVGLIKSFNASPHTTKIRFPTPLPAPRGKNAVPLSSQPTRRLIEAIAHLRSSRAAFAGPCQLGHSPAHQVTFPEAAIIADVPPKVRCGFDLMEPVKI
jgi:hypothetical protein